jgi:hypothetical protein
LAFHPYPQVIQLLCNAGRFGPPVRITGPSACPWVAHPVSGLLRATNALFRLAFAPAPRFPALNLATHSNSPAHSSIGTPSHHTGAPTACGRAVSGSLSLPSRGAFHRSLTVLVHYRSVQVFSLGTWSPQLPTGFHLTRGTQVSCPSLAPVAYGTLTPLVGPSRSIRLKARLLTRRHQSQQDPPTPSKVAPPGFRLLPFRSPLLGEYFSFPRGTEMFQFPRCPSVGPSPTDARPSRRAGCPIRRPPDQRVRPLPDAFRRHTASFLGPHHLGIPRAPSLA